jgi:predicted nucleotidyltransferase component of viral defense system
MYPLLRQRPGTDGGSRVIDLETLRRIARTKGISNMGFAEKDYFQEILLLGVSREAPELVFKGGTALYKLHGLDRFSEDLDFSGRIAERQANRISSYLNHFGYPYKLSLKKVSSGALLNIAVEGLLFQGGSETMARVRVDLSGRDDIEMEPEWLTLFSLYPDIPSLRLRTMVLEEMLAEKVRGLMVRMKARDAYDIWFLLGKGVSADSSLIEKKLKMYNMALDKVSLDKTLDKCQKEWKRELRPLIVNPPKFEAVRKGIREKLLP